MGALESEPTQLLETITATTSIGAALSLSRLAAVERAFKGLLMFFRGIRLRNLGGKAPQYYGGRQQTQSPEIIVLSTGAFAAPTFALLKRHIGKRLTFAFAKPMKSPGGFAVAAMMTPASPVGVRVQSVT